jgi:peptidyl-prolyl cis-trans isomerase B (cyclophilin B)
MKANTLAGIAVVLILSTVSQVAAAPPSDTGYVQILELERTRSLGDGALAKLVNNADQAIAARAALALGRTKNPEARPALIRCLSKPSVSVRAMCAYGLGLIGISADAATLAPFVNDSEPAVRYAVADALGRLVSATPALGDDALAATVLTMATRDSDAVVRGHAAISLAAFDKSPAAGALPDRIAAAFRAEADTGVRSRLMWAVARGFALAAREVLLKSGLSDPDEYVRVATVRALGKRKSDPLAPQLVREMLNDPSWRVQYEAREALLTLGGKGRTEHLTAIPPGVHVPPAPDRAVQPSPAAPALAAKLSPPPVTAVTPLALSITDAASMQGEPLQRNGRPRVRVVTTKGAFTLVLFSEWAPYTVANFLSLAKQGYFNGDRWFRIVPDFVVQTGDKSNTGDGDAGYMIPAEENPIEQTTGIISMGLNYSGSKPQRDSAGSQFYLTLSPQYHLDRDFTVFGKIVDGFNVLPNLVESDSIVRVEIL